MDAHDPVVGRDNLGRRGGGAENNYLVDSGGALPLQEVFNGADSRGLHSVVVMELRNDLVSYFGVQSVCMYIDACHCQWSG